MKNKQHRVYYAHSLQTYNSQKEHEERLFLNSIFDNVLCPNKDIETSIYNMGFFQKIVSWSSLIVVTEYLEHIGSGVYLEIDKAFRCKIPVLCLKKIKKSYEFYAVKGTEKVNRMDIKIKYAKVILGEKVDPNSI